MSQKKFKNKSKNINFLYLANFTGQVSEEKKDKNKLRTFLKHHLLKKKMNI